MPTVIYLRGWRLHFYSDEGNEPIHIHAQRGDAQCKYWLKVESYDIVEAYSYNLTKRDTREIRKIILLHFDEIVEAWDGYFKGKNN